MDLPDNVNRLCGKKRFAFDCHPGVACFTECCRALDLALTPYDVLRLRQELLMSSAEFIDRYVVVEQDGNNGFPSLYLGMVDDGKASCPFISESGCRVYKNRPGACRAYPVGRGTTLAANGKVREIHVLVREDHCQGFAEHHSHNVAEWFEKQGLAEYNAINDEVLCLLHDEKICLENPTQEEKDMLLLVLYRLDEFRQMVTSPAFQGNLAMAAEERQAVPADDLSLLRFGIRWLKATLFAEKT